MSVLVRLPTRERLQAVILERCGTGWRVGIGSLVEGRIEREASCHLGERAAEAAAVKLGDDHDLLAVRA